MLRAFLLVMLNLCLVGTAGAAGFELLSQARSVSTELSSVVDCLTPPFLQTCEQGYEAAYGPASLDLMEQPSGYEAFSAFIYTDGSSAEQQSSMSPWSIGATGSIQAAYVDFFDGNYSVLGSTTANSSFSATFLVTEATEYTLTGLLSGVESDTPNLTLRARLLDSGGEVAGVDCVMQLDGLTWKCGPESIAVSGVLSPGTYTLEAEIDGMGSPPISGVSPGLLAGATYEISLTTIQPVPSLSAGGMLMAILGLAVFGSRRLVS